MARASASPVPSSEVAASAGLPGPAILWPPEGSELDVHVHRPPVVRHGDRSRDWPGLSGPSRAGAPRVDVQSTYRRFCQRTLPPEAWTHEAHLAVCWSDLQQRTPSASLVFLRDAIPAFNQSIGIVNSESSGYHETLTCYYVAAIAARAAISFDQVLAWPEAGRDAPGRYWTTERLFSAEARRRWVDPDRQVPEFEGPWTP